MFNPITKSIEEREKLFQIDKERLIKEINEVEEISDFYDLMNHIRKGLLEQMKIFIIRNYEKISLEEWNKEWILYKDKSYGTHSFSKMFISNKAPGIKKEIDSTTPIENISFVYDEHDGDLSISVNRKEGEKHFEFLNAFKIRVYYCTIKNKLKK